MDTSMVASFLVLLLAFPTVFAIDHIVGDDIGWVQGFDYTKWTSGKTFKVGDNLVFKYELVHNLSELPDEKSYKKCRFENSLLRSMNGNSTVALTKEGKRYFSCSYPGHCKNGMKLEINVVAASSSSTTPSKSSGAVVSSGIILLMGSFFQ